MITEKIYEAARELEKNAQGLSPFALLGVELSDGQFVYIGGELRSTAVGIYVGDSGLQGFLRLWEELKDDRVGKAYLYNRLRPDIPFLRLSFAGDEALTAEELAFCRAQGDVTATEEEVAVEKEGTDDSDREEVVWPVLRYCEPFLMDREVTDTQQLAQTEEALTALEWFLQQKEPGEAWVSLLTLYVQGQMAILSPEGEGYALRTVRLPRVRKSIPPQVMSPELGKAADQLRRLPRSGAWESKLYEVTPEKMITEPDTPLAAYVHGVGRQMILYFRNQDGIAFGQDTMPVVLDHAQHPAHLLELLIQSLEEAQTIPQQIYVEDEWTQSYLQAFCKRLKIKLYRVKKLKHLLDPEALQEQDEFVVAAREQMLRQPELAASYQQMAQTVEKLVDCSELDGLKNYPDGSYEAACELRDLHLLPARTLRKLVAMEKAEPVPENPQGYVIGIRAVREDRVVQQYLHIRAGASLQELGQEIRRAVGLEEAAGAFYTNGMNWEESSAVYDPGADEEKHGKTTDEVTLGELGLSRGRKLRFVPDVRERQSIRCRVMRLLAEPVERTTVICEGEEES